MTWQPCPRCGDGNPWRAVWCEGCGALLGVDAVRAPDLPTPPKAVRLPRSECRTSESIQSRRDG